MRPAAFVLTAILSTWILSDSLRKRFPVALIIGWTLGTLLFPPVIFPLYLIFRIAFRKRETRRDDEDESVADSAEHQRRETTRTPRLLPLIYLLSLLSFGALFYILDYKSVDAHLARATHARLLGNREKTISELRAALAIEDDAHTHYLLGVELEEAGRSEEALAEFRAAGRGGEPDPELHFHLGTTLDALNKRDEANDEFRKFLTSALCTHAPADARCAAVESRLRDEVR